MSKNRRIMRELEDTRNDENSGVTLKLQDESNIDKLIGTFNGPPDSPYEGGKFVVNIEVPAEYPFKPPKMQFQTRVYHPNISSQTGAICLDILKDRWTPIMTLKSSLISLQALLQSPEPDDPQDAIVAGVYKSNKEEFDRKAREWTKMYAMKDKEPEDPYQGLEPAAVQMFENMGFDRSKVVAVLKKFNIKSSNEIRDNGLEDMIVERLS